MADEAISELTPVGTVEGTEALPSAKGGANFKITTDELAAYATNAASVIAALDGASIPVITCAAGDYVLCQDVSNGEAFSRFVLSDCVREQQFYIQYFYNSSGAQSGNRYNDWQDLCDAIVADPGIVTIVFEQNETLPAGTYDMTNVTWYAEARQLLVTAIQRKEVDEDQLATAKNLLADWPVDDPRYVPAEEE